MTDEALNLYPSIKLTLEKVIHNRWLESTNGRLESTNPMVRTNQALPDNKPDNKQQIKSSCANDQKAFNKRKHDFAPMMNEQKHINAHEVRKSQEMRISPEAKKHYEKAMRKGRGLRGSN